MGRSRGSVPAALALLAAAPLAAETMSIQAITANTPNLGGIAAAAVGDTVFRIDPATGAVTKLSGAGARTSFGSTRARVTVRCTGGTGPCRRTPVRVRVGAAGSPSGRAGALTNFTVASGTAVVRSAPAPADPIEFVLEPLGRNIDRTFWIGADFTVRGDSSGLSTGSAGAAFNVRVASDPEMPAIPGRNGLAVANVRRATSIAKLSDLEFGALVRPPSGTSAVTIDPATGDRSIAGAAAFALPGSSPSRAAYTVSGEGGRSLSVSLPASFEMSHASGSDTIPVTLAATDTLLTLSGSTGQGGGAALGVGGSFNLPNDARPGAYSGSFTVTIQYN